MALTASKQDLAAGWDTDTMIPKSDDPVSTWASTNQDSAIDYLAAFDDWYGQEIVRSTHLEVNDQAAHCRAENDTVGQIPGRSNKQVSEEGF